jgi:hypothetical protein
MSFQACGTFTDQQPSGRGHPRTLAQATESDSAQTNQIHEFRAAGASKKLANQIQRTNLVRLGSGCSPKHWRRRGKREGDTVR